MNAEITLDCFGLLCPLPVRKTAQQLTAMTAGQVLHVIATDPLFEIDLQAWIHEMPYTLLSLEVQGEEIHAYIKK